MTSPSVRFPIRFTGANQAMVALGIFPSRCFVDVGVDSLRVQMTWAFSATVPRSAVRAATLDHGAVMGWGVHGWRGSWLVNGSSSGIVRVEIDPPVLARLLVWPVKLRVLRVAVEDPDGLVLALNGPNEAGP
ncbi:MAG: hypothetical protein ACXWCB_18460 [Acidimicrobiales bacterium]